MLLLIARLGGGGRNVPAPSSYTYRKLKNESRHRHQTLHTPFLVDFAHPDQMSFSRF